MKRLNALHLKSPLGDISLEAYMNGSTISNTAPELFDEASSNPSKCGWFFKDIQIELLKTSFIPKLPQGMKVSACIAYLWRFKILSNKMDLKFSCRLSLNDPSLEREPESGEGLIAQSWGHDSARITLGTEDEEFLLGRAKHQLGMPPRLAHEAFLTPEIIDYLKDGIAITLPTVLESEEGQVQFVIAWTEGENCDEISTWYAVDASYQEIINASTKTPLQNPTQ